MTHSNYEYIRCTIQLTICDIKIRRKQFRSLLTTIWLTSRCRKNRKIKLETKNYVKSDLYWNLRPDRVFMGRPSGISHFCGQLRLPRGTASTWPCSLLTTRKIMYARVAPQHLNCEQKAKENEYTTYNKENV